MSDFVDNLSHFITKCRNDILEEACENKDYAAFKTKSMNIYEILYASIHSEYQELLSNFADEMTAISCMEDNYCYLCGMRDSDKADIQFNPLDKETPAELAAYNRYADARSRRTDIHNKLKVSLDAECRKLLDEYVENKKIILDIERTYCYAGGTRDKKRLDIQFDPSAAKEWTELLNTLI